MQGKSYEKKCLKHDYKDLPSLIHEKRRAHVDTVETNGHLDTSAALKNHIDVKLEKNLKPPIATLRK